MLLGISLKLVKVQSSIIVQKKRNSIAFYLVPGIRKSVQYFSHNSPKSKSGRFLKIDISVCIFFWFTGLFCVHKAKQSNMKCQSEVTNILVWNCVNRKFYDGCEIHTLKNHKFKVAEGSKQRQTLKNKQLDLCLRHFLFCLTLKLTFLECIHHSDITKLPYDNSIPKIMKLLN